jgi:SagB-type dehydrogenase family enzyme
LQPLATLLQRTWGVQHRAHVPGQGPIVLKTAPSGGARHSIEAYVVAQRVAGLERGVYHYDAASHELVRIGKAVRRKALTHALAKQDYFLPAGAIVIMTAVFERAMWRYPFSRAYRTVLAEAGHHGQTFCLLATALNLAPFCTMAFRDTDLESLIGVDGVNESAVYVVGVGTRPKRHVKNPGRIPPKARR